MPDFKTIRFLGSGTFPGWFSTADFNEDGILDLVYTDTVSHALSTTGSLYLYLGTGDGYFEAPVELTTSEKSPVFIFLTDSGNLSVAAGNLNSDGAIDLAVGNLSSVVSILLSR